MTLIRSKILDTHGAPLKILHADTEAEINLALAGPWLGEPATGRSIGSPPRTSAPMTSRSTWRSPGS